MNKDARLASLVLVLLHPFNHGVDRLLMVRIRIGHDYICSCALFFQKIRRLEVPLDGFQSELLELFSFLSLASEDGDLEVGGITAMKKFVEDGAALFKVEKGGIAKR